MRLARRVDGEFEGERIHQVHVGKDALLAVLTNLLPLDV